METNLGGRGVPCCFSRCSTSIDNGISPSQRAVKLPLFSPPLPVRVTCSLGIGRRRSPELFASLVVVMAELRRGGGGITARESAGVGSVWYGCVYVSINPFSFTRRGAVFLSGTPTADPNSNPLTKISRLPQISGVLFRLNFSFVISNF